MAKANWRRLRSTDVATFVAFAASIPLNVLLSVEIPGFDIHLSEDKADHIPLLNSKFNTFTYFKIHTREADYQTLSDISISSAVGSAATYMGRGVDRIRGYKTPWNDRLLISDKHSKKEFHDNLLRDYGTIAGIIAGFAIGVPVAVLLFLYGGWMFILALTVFTAAMSIIRSTAGLGSRIMQLADKIRRKKYGDLLKNYESSIFLSLFLGAVPLIIMGVSGGLGSGVFDIISFAITSIILLSTINSGAHYIGRLLDFIDERYSLGWLFIAPVLEWFGADLSKYKSEGAWDKSKTWKQNFIERCTNEQLANVAGLLIGLVVGILAVTVLSIFTPSVMLVIPGFLALKYCLTVFGLMNTFASISIRFGRAIDRIYSTDEEKAPTFLHGILDWDVGNADRSSVNENLGERSGSDADVSSNQSSRRSSFSERDQRSHEAAQNIGLFNSTSNTSATQPTTNTDPNSSHVVECVR